MSPILLTLGSIIVYIAGLVLIMRVVPLLLKRSFDDMSFIGIAAGAIVGGILTFGAVGLTFAYFNGNFGVRVLDFLFLAGILIVGVRTAMRCYRPRFAGLGTSRMSRFLAGSFCLLLAGAAVYSLVLLFKPA